MNSPRQKKETCLPTLKLTQQVLEGASKQPTPPWKSSASDLKDPRTFGSHTINAARNLEDE